MSARAQLRAGTAVQHDRVDRLFSRLDLAQEEDYRRFLLAQTAAFLPIEGRLDAAGIAQLVPDWRSRRRADLLRADLSALGLKEPPHIPPPALDSPAAQLGAVYVLEGSRLGGAMLRRGLAESVPHSFLSAPQNRGSWRKLLETLDMFLYRSDRLDAAMTAAKGVFQNFEAGGQLYLESR